MCRRGSTRDGCGYRPSRRLAADWRSMAPQGWTTAALPPPRRTGSAAASVRPPERNSIPVTAPISVGGSGGSGCGAYACPRASSAWPSGELVNVGLRRGGGGVPLDRPRLRDRLGQGRAEIDALEQHLEDGARDRGSARRADRHERPAAAGDDRRAHRAARALVAVGAVRVGERVEVEVGELVVHEEAVAGHDHRVAAGRLDRERVGDDVALAV